MKDLIENWTYGLSYLITDDLISFYTFFTVIFAECSYLWAFYEASVAMPITIILLGYILNVMVSAWFKGMREGTKSEKVISIIYVIIFVTLFVIGCFFNWAITTITTAIALCTTALSIEIRNNQDTFRWLPEGTSKIAYLINNLFQNKTFWILSQIIIIGYPLVVFVIFFAKISFIPTLLKVIIPMLYFILAPFIAYFEDDTAACNIFELAYDVTWDKEYEEFSKKIDKLQKDIENKKM